MTTTTRTTTALAARQDRRSQFGRQETGPSRPPPKPKWQQQLTWAAADDEPGFLVRAITTPRPKTREIWYVLDEKMSGDAGKLVLLFFQRETKANGQFGKLKQLSIRPNEVGRLASAEDAEILNLLLGYHDVESHDYYYGYSSSRVSEAELPKNMQQFLLPKLAATQRLARVEKWHLSPAGVRRPSAAGLGRRAAVAVPSGHPVR